MSARQNHDNAKLVEKVDHATNPADVQAFATYLLGLFIDGCHEPIAIVEGRPTGARGRLVVLSNFNECIPLTIQMVRCTHPYK
jgi:hypothetical protein